MENLVHDLEEVVRAPLLVVAHDVRGHHSIDLFNNLHLRTAEFRQLKVP
jgi:hypothetical protein